MVCDFAIVFTLSILPYWIMISTNLSWTLATQVPGKVLRIIWASFPGWGTSISWWTHFLRWGLPASLPGWNGKASTCLWGTHLQTIPEFREFALSCELWPTLDRKIEIVKHTQILLVLRSTVLPTWFVNQIFSDGHCQSGGVLRIWVTNVQQYRFHEGRGWNWHRGRAQMWYLEPGD